MLCMYAYIFQQISNLVQHRSERPHSIATERTLRAIGRVGQAVNLAVERFVTVGETIADDNPDIKQDMYDACKEARAAGMNMSINKIHIYQAFTRTGDARALHLYLSHSLNYLYK